MALTADVKIERYGVPGNASQKVNQPLGNNVKLYGGSFAVTDASTGYLKNAATLNSTDKVWGLVSRFTDNTGGASAAQNVDIECGSFFLPCSTGADAVTQANIGATVYVYDEKTVALTSNGSTRPVAGIVEAIDKTQPFGGVAIKLGTAQSTGAPQ
jgi:hypothetical protein